MKYREIEEGKRKYITLSSNLVPRKKDDAFFNVHQQINRDLSVLVLRSYSKIRSIDAIKICEVFCGIGIRSCRYALETPSSKVFCNDLNQNALEISRRNIERLPFEYSSKIRLFSQEANLFLQHLNSKDHVFDFVDIDPYGTPIPFIQNAIQITNKNGILGITATDLATLAGVYPRALYAKYGLTTYDKRLGNVHEIAARSMIAGVQKVGLGQNQSLIPIITLYYRHFIRSFFMRYRGVKRVLDQTGFIIQCRNCLKIFTRPLDKHGRCPSCGSDKEWKIGPFFIGPIHQKEFLESINQDLHINNLGTKKKLKKIINLMIEESKVDLPWSFDIPIICDEIGTQVPSINELISELSELGYTTARTHFSGMTIKTNAPLIELYKILRHLRPTNHSTS
ncbi:MAG: hypothetical protein ACTSW1_12385 [Candidatus Hodarchaeales archaeon]